MLLSANKPSRQLSAEAGQLQGVETDAKSDRKARQLSDAVSQLLGGAPEVQAAQSRQLHFELVDLELPRQKQRTLLVDELL